jgi:hypothetical protein
MAYDSTKPADDSYLADFPATDREQERAIINDQIVDALKLQGLTPGNLSGNIPVSNGTLNVNLNAEELGGNLASAFAVSGHTHAAATGSSNGFMSNTDYTKLSGVATGAEVNQNAFSNILVGATTVQADSKTDTLEIVNGANITVTPDAANDRLTVAVSGTVPSATTAGSCTGNAATATNATSHISASSGAHAASAISSTATGDVSATNVQAAIAELASEKASLATMAATTDGASGADKVGVTAISGISGATVQALLEALKSYVDNKVVIGTSATAAATAAKTVALSSFALTTGASVLVTFTNGNTVAGALTLNVNSTGAKTIYHEDGNAVSATHPAYFPAGVQIEFTYNGTRWVFKNRIVINYVNGASWYRIWSDGWIEQGFVVTTGSSSGTANLVKTLITTNYNVQIHNTTGYRSMPISNKTISAFTWTQINVSAGVATADSNTYDVLVLGY